MQYVKSSDESRVTGLEEYGLDEMLVSAHLTSEHVDETKQTQSFSFVSQKQTTAESGSADEMSFLAAYEKSSEEGKFRVSMSAMQVSRGTSGLEGAYGGVNKGRTHTDGCAAGSDDIARFEGLTSVRRRRNQTIGSLQGST